MRGELTIERVLAHPPERVWQRIASEAGGASFFSAPDFRAEVGHRFIAEVPRGPGFDGRVRAEVLEVDPPHRIRMFWAGGPVSGEVRVVLQPHGDGGCRLLLVQTGFDRTRQATLTPALLGLWNQRLDLLGPASVAAASGGAAGGIGASTGMVIAASVAGLVALLLAFLGVWSLLPEPPLPATASSTMASPPTAHTSVVPPPADVPPHPAPREGAHRPIEEVPPVDPWKGPAGGDGGRLSYFETDLPSTLNPLYARTVVDRRTHELIFERPFYRSAITNELRSSVIAKYQIRDDGRTLRIWLRPDMRWHDGEVVGADDLCFSVQAFLEPFNPSMAARDLREDLAGCEVRDALEVDVRLRRAFPDARERLAGLSLLPRHVFGGDPRIPVDHVFGRQPVGGGPFSARMGRREVDLRAAPGTARRAAIEGLTLLPGGDPFVQARTILNAGVHGIISVPPALRPEIAASDDVVLKTYDLRSWWFLALNTNERALADVHVRRAVDAALDRSELRELTIGVDSADPDPPCELISGPFVRSSPYYNRQIRVVEEDDPERVRREMSAAGATQVAGRWMFAGRPVRLRIGMHAPLEAEARGLLEQVGNQLRVAGFEVEVYKVASDDWNGKVAAGQVTDFDVLIGKWSFGEVEDVGPLFHTRTGGKGALNLFNFSDPTTDRLLAKHEAATTDTQARDAMHALHEHLADELPYVYLWKLDTRSAWRSGIRGTTIAPDRYWTEVSRWRATR